MIKNDRQYKITKSQAERFRSAASEIKEKLTHPVGEDESLKLQLQLSALEAQLGDLETDLRSYESLQENRNESMEITSLNELPSVLVKARIASRLSQKQLAEKLGLKEQQIQRYEATDYAGANLSRIDQIVQALGVKLRKQLFIPEVAVTPDHLFKKLGQVGFSKEFVKERLISRKLRAHLASGTAIDCLDGLVFQNVANISRVFNWEPSAFLSNMPLELDYSVVSQTRFKMPASANSLRASAYTVYAHYLALLMIQATPDMGVKPIPCSWRQVRAQVLGTFGEISLLNLVKYVWSLGVVILPLKDSGQFHAATWRVRGRNVIVIKQKSSSEARWIIDLLHDLWHAAQSPELAQHGIVEELPPYNDEEQLMQEEAANDFAADVVFNGKSTDLAEECAIECNKRLEWLKSAVLKVAKRHDIRVDLLANYLAYRLEQEGQNWWATATKLQRADVDPWQQVRDFVIGKIKWEALGGGDRELLAQALETGEFSNEDR
jgi:transcriptional regulator with XRE-family HTH domain